MKKKKILISIISIVLVIALLLVGKYLYRQYQIKNAKIEVELVSIMETEFLNEVRVSDFIKSINGTIIDDYIIDTSKIGMKNVKFTFINEDDIKVKYDYDLNIVDTTAPLVWLGDTYNITKGSEINLIDKILCGDNYDNTPKCEIIGEYDVNNSGAYQLVFQATDESGNVTKKDFTLNVKEPKKTSGGGTFSTTGGTKTYFSDIVKEHKNENTQIGLDISKWQGDVDFEKLKNAGVEFVFIRVGSTNGINGDFFVDSKFEQNIKNANEVGIPVGIYFYSYADSEKQAKEEAKWILNQIKDYDVDLPIVFDWENWSMFNEFDLSFFGLTNMATSFIDVVEKSGYQGMLYSSKTYLENIWLDVDYPIWLAHYVNNTTYEGNYDYWQLCNNGRVDGINGDVDINIRYLK